jgi:hypothetical protein
MGWFLLLLLFKYYYLFFGFLLFNFLKRRGKSRGHSWMVVTGNLDILKRKYNKARKQRRYSKMILNKSQTHSLFMY